MKRLTLISLIACMAAAPAFAAPTQSDTPIEIHSDTLDVLQEENKAIFKGNVVATQGNTDMRSSEMVVFYANDEKAGTTPTEGEEAAPQGIHRIEAQGNVVFATPAETALGDKAIYDVKADTLDLYGAVTLTRGKNVLKGTRLNHNMKTGRSVLSGGTVAGGKPGRVHGLFMPKSDKPAGK